MLRDAALLNGAFMSNGFRWLFTAAIAMSASISAVSFTAAYAQLDLRMTVAPAVEPSLQGARAPRDATPTTRVGHGKHDIAYAWFAQPTDRYGHRALGAGAESASLMVQTSDGAVLVHTLQGNAVFEDLYPRVHDFGRDGRDEILVVHSDPSEGASLMVLGIRNGALVRLAKSAPTGRRFTWLNPVGIADVNDNGRDDVLAVETPHIGGTLVLYSFEANRFTELQRVDGVSNHAFGSRSQRLSALIDAHGDGVPDLVIPSADRKSLRAFSLRSGRALEFARLELPSPAAGDFEVLPPRTLIVPLEDGRRIRIDWE